MACRAHWWYHPSQVVLQFAKLLCREGKCCNLHCHRLSCQFLFVEFHSVVSWSHWGAHCTGMLLVWSFRSDSVSDADTWDEVSFIGDACASKSFFCLNSGMWVFLWVSLVNTLWILVKWVSWGCCQTTSGFGGSVKWVTYGLSITAPEWRRGIFSLIFGLPE